jgi:NADPH-dependent 2,4-dienoyl-CoA reductase/sulfur reductase-like enzyme
MTRSCDVAIIGAGFAGLAAAEILAADGLKVRILDENAHVGGQLLRKPAVQPSGSGRFELDGIRRSGLRLLARVTRHALTVSTGTQVLGIFPENRILTEDPRGRVSELKADFVICAPGAREKFIPFKGWTLPGVISTGAAQILIKGSGVLPAAVTVIGGLGPLQFVLAREISSHGGRVPAVLDQSAVTEKIKALRLLPRHGLTLLEGVRILGLLRLAGIPIRSGWRIIEAKGRGHLEAVVAARCNRDGHVITGTESVYPTSCLAVGYGFVPNIELPLQAGCTADYRPERGGWVVRVDDSQETSLPNVFAAGEATGIAGARKSFIEGRICGWAILEKLGRAVPQSRRRLDRLARERRHELNYGAFLNAMCRGGSGGATAIPDETVICRCEDVRMADIRRRIAEGFHTPAALKKACRCGMGNCQGRVCGPILHDILAAEAGVAAQAFGPASIRAPIKTVRLGALADSDLS